MKLNYADYPTPEFGELPTSRFDEEVDIRHHKVVDIIRRHLKDIHAEIQRLDPEMLNLDDAGDKAEIARQVLIALVEQLRGVASGLQRRRNCTGADTCRCDGSKARVVHPKRHYRSTIDIAALCRLPVADIMAKDAAACFWVYGPPDTLKVIEAWKLTYKSALLAWTRSGAG